MNEPIKQLRISDLRKLLEQLQAEHGDLRCVLTDADTNCGWRMKASHLDAVGEKLYIGGNYGDERDDN